jgi:hypothetical protein
MPLLTTQISFSQLNTSVANVTPSTSQLKLSTLLASNNFSLFAGVWPPANTATSLSSFRYNFSGTQTGSKLVESTISGWTRLGYSVDLSSDGTTLAVGAPNNRGSRGSVFIFTGSGTSWTQQAILEPTNFTEIRDVYTGVGYSVAVSSDGNTVAMGAKGSDNNVGAVFIYTRSGSTWSQQTKLTGSGMSASSALGTSVAMSADGNTVVSGASGDASGVGAVVVWTRSGTTWTQQGAKITPTGHSGAANFGFSISCSTDGNTVSVGAPADNSNRGATFVFTRSGTTWSQQGSKLSNPTDSSQGYSVSMSSDGNTLAASSAAFTDYVVIYTRSGSTWTGLRVLLTELFPQRTYESSVSISADGNTLIVGYLSDSYKGAVWILKRSGSSWTQASKNSVTPRFARNAAFGRSVKIVGSTVIVGASGEGYPLGTAYAFSYNGTSLTSETKCVITGYTSAAQQGQAMAVNATNTTLVVGAPLEANSTSSNYNTDVGACFVYTKSGSSWVLQSKLQTTDYAAQPYLSTSQWQGKSVDISGDGNTIVVGGHGESDARTSAWIWTRSGTTWSQQGSRLAGSGANTVGAFSSETQMVAISKDGNTVAYSDVFDSGGAVWVYTRSGTTWTQQSSKLTATESVAGTGLGFGSSIALDATGDTLAIGAKYNDSWKGAFWVYSRSGSTWSIQGNRLVGSSVTTGAWLGYSISLSADGNTLAVGAPLDSTVTSNRGSVFIYRRTGTTWSQQTKLVPVDSSVSVTGAYFGSDVRLSADGNMLIVGAPQIKTSDNVYRIGGVFIFTRSGTTWSQQGSSFRPNNYDALLNNPQIGSSLAMTPNGQTILMGNYFDAGQAGATWTFT